MKPHFAALATLAALAATSPALAQNDDLSPARMAQLDQKASELKLKVDHNKATDIARSKGLATLKEIQLTKRGNWKLEGIDTQGHQIEMRIDGKSGKLEKLERH